MALLAGLLAGSILERPCFENLGTQEAQIHLSVDDTLLIFRDLTENTDYDSIFDQPQLAFCRDLHERYGMVFSFYCFYSGGDFSLAQATDAFRTEFARNADWMKFGFHAKDAAAYGQIDAETEQYYYEQTLQELRRITGGDQCIDTGFLRLDRFWGTAEIVEALHETEDGPEGLLCAEEDPQRTSYDLTPDEAGQMYLQDYYYKENGMYYTPTDLRVENIKSVVDFYRSIRQLFGQKTQVIFTHESLLLDAEVKKYLQWIGEYAQATGAKFEYIDTTDWVTK